MVICLEWCAYLHMAQLMPLPLTVSCSNEIQIGFTFLVPAHLGSPGQRAVKRVCVCVCVRACVRVYPLVDHWRHQQVNCKITKRSSSLCLLSFMLFCCWCLSTNWLQQLSEIGVLEKSGARFANYLTNYHNSFVRSIYGGDLVFARLS